jgi:hypothetical protein
LGGIYHFIGSGRRTQREGGHDGREDTKGGRTRREGGRGGIMDCPNKGEAIAK